MVGAEKDPEKFFVSSESIQDILQRKSENMNTEHTDSLGL